MKKKYMIFIGLLIIFSMTLTACAGTDNKPEADKDLAQDSMIKELRDENNKLIELNKELELQLSNNSNTITPQNLYSLSLDVMELIKDKDMAGLATHVHPSKDLTFTPNVHIQICLDKKFTVQEVAGLFQDTNVYNWGYYLTPVDTEIELNFEDYYDLYVYDEDYINADILGNNFIVNTGDEIDNIDDAYPNADFVEFMFVGAAHNTGSDWRSLKLVFEEENGQNYLIAIVHGQWIDILPQ